MSVSLKMLKRNTEKNPLLSHLPLQWLMFGCEDVCLYSSKINSSTRCNIKNCHPEKKVTANLNPGFNPGFGPDASPLPAHFPTECVVGLVWILMVLYDMCVLMSATAPNSCKLAVYEGEVP